jgi:aspartate/methionine/tyrosine aminotransferase
VERALSRATRAVLIVNPNNPTGNFVRAEELARLAALCADRDAAIVADEVFADYELGASVSVAGQLATRTDVLGFTLGGLSKSIGLPQTKLGWIAISGAGAAVDAALARLEFTCDTYLSVSTPVQVAAARLLDRGAVVRRQIQERVKANYRGLIRSAARAPACTVLQSDAGWYAVVQVPSLMTEEELVLTLLEKDHVLVHPGYFFDFSAESFVVVSLLVSPAAFADGTSRLFRHFDCSAGAP